MYACMHEFIWVSVEFGLILYSFCIVGYRQKCHIRTSFNSSEKNSKFNLSFSQSQIIVGTLFMNNSSLI